MEEHRWLGSVSLAAAVGVLYYIVAYLSLSGLFYYQSEGVTVFWAAAGISSGLLIGFGSRVRWSIVAGVFVAAFLIPFVVLGRGIWLATIFAICDVTEPIIIAGLIARYFGVNFALDQLRKVFGLLGATIAGTVPSSLGGAVASRLFLGPEAQILTTWLHWWTGVAVGVVTVAPIVIGLSAALREPPPRSEQFEGTAGLLALAAMTGGCAFAHAAARGDGRARSAVVSRVVVARRTLSTCLRRRGSVDSFPHDRMGDNLRHRSFWKLRPANRLPSRAGAGGYPSYSDRRTRACCPFLRSGGRAKRASRAQTLCWSANEITDY
jgi:hypothetical protein